MGHISIIIVISRSVDPPMFSCSAVGTKEEEGTVGRGRGGVGRWQSKSGFSFLVLLLMLIHIRWCNKVSVRKREVVSGARCGPAHCCAVGAVYVTDFATRTPCNGGGGLISSQHLALMMGSIGGAWLLREFVRRRTSRARQPVLIGRARCRHVAYGGDVAERIVAPLVVCFDVCVVRGSPAVEDGRSARPQGRIQLPNLAWKADAD